MGRVMTGDTLPSVSSAPVPSSSDWARAVLAEAGQAIADRSRTVASSSLVSHLDAVVDSLKEGVSSIDLDAIWTRCGPALEAATTGLEVVRRAGQAGITWFWSTAARGAEVAACVGRRVGLGTSVPVRVEREALLHEALLKQDALLSELNRKNEASAERLNYLQVLVTQLQAMIEGLRDDRDPTEDLLAVMAAQRRRLNAEAQRMAVLDAGVAAAVWRAERLVGPATAVTAVDIVPASVVRSAPVIRSWDELVAEAIAEPGAPATFDDVLTREEQAAVLAELSAWNEEFEGLHRLTPFDWSVAGAAGLLGALAHVLLVRVPAHPGFLGATVGESGWLSRVLDDGFSRLLPADTVRALERAYPVPFDVSTNHGLAYPVAGLSPGTHRLQAIGHDPLLGWIFGVRDVLCGSFTALGTDGSVVVQPGVGGVADTGGIFSRLVGAFGTVAGHMASDVATPAGLPPPLFAPLLRLHGHSIGGHDVAEITVAMYRSGYDFRHFLAGGVCTAAIEVVVRTSWLVRELAEGKALGEALPVGRKPRLQTGLFIAHTVAAAVDAGKVAITQNPLMVNWAQWLAFFRYALPQLHWLMIGKAHEREVFLDGKLDEAWAGFDASLSRRWRRDFSETPAAVL